MPDEGEITSLLHRSSKEETTSADRLWELVYPELRRRARNLFRGERSDHTLSPTGVVNEAFLRIATQKPVEWKDRSHFYAVASGVMRHVLIDHARARSAGKRGGGAIREVLDENVFPALTDDDEGFRAAAEALEGLAETNDRAALVVSLRVFGGLTVEEAADEIGVSPRTIKTDWNVARVRLRALLSE